MIKKTFFLSLLTILVFSCKKEDPTPTPSTPVVPVTPVEEEYFLKATIGGALWSAVNTENGCLIGYGQSATVGDSIELDYSTYFSQDENVSPITSPLNGIFQIKMSNFKHELEEYMNSNTIFKESFTIGAHIYYSTGSMSVGPEITYEDEFGVEWSTRYGSQSGSNFAFTSAVDGVISGEPVKFVKGYFNCKLYDAAVTSSKTVTNGTFYVIFEKY